MDDRKQAIREFLGRAFGDRPLEEAEDIFTLGYVSSLFVMDLVLFVEGTFGVVVERRDLDPANFRSILAIAALVDRKSPVGAE